MNRIVITMDGGLIQHICSDRPGDIQVIIVDFDVQGTEEKTVHVNFSDGASEEALVSIYPVEVGDTWLDTAQVLATAEGGLSGE